MISDDFKGFFNEKVLLQGKECYLKGKVHNVRKKQKGLVEAAVFGENDDFRVMVEYDGLSVTNLECTCPLAKDGMHCKHEAAVLYYLKDSKEPLSDASCVISADNPFLADIREKLTGDDMLDFACITSEMYRIKDINQLKQLLSMVNSISENLINRNRFETIEDAVNGYGSPIRQMYEEIKSRIYRGDYERIESGLNELEQLVSDTYQDTDEVSYFNFSHAFEYYLYLIKFGSNQPLIRLIPEKVFAYYFNLGQLLSGAEKFDLAQIAFSKALKINPLSVKALLDMADLFEKFGETDEFYSLTLKALEYSFFKEDYARGYRNLGHYFVFKNKFSLAIACYMISNIYHYSDKASAELLFISQKMNQVIYNPSIEQIEKIFDENNIPFGPDDDVVRLSYFMGQKMQQDFDYEAASYFYEICYGLTQDEKVKRILDELRNA